MKTIYALLIGTLFISLLNTGCVSGRKYKESQARIEKLRSDSTATHLSVKECNASLSECNNSLKRSRDLMSKQSDNNATVVKNLQENSANSQMTIAEQEKRLASMQKIINAQKEIMYNLKKTVSDALVGFTPEELSVEIKDGNIYVSLQEKLLFKSGSDQVDPKGKLALQKLAPVLNNNADIHVNIEGHTDHVPIQGKFADNWALSVSRATSIVRILTKDAGVDPHRVVASGRGEFSPVDDNSTDTGKARNRRTEIILSPNLTELFKLLNQ